MAIINGKALVKDGKPLDRVYSNGHLVYGRNLLRDTVTQSSDDWFNTNYTWTSDKGTYLGSRIFRTSSAWDNTRYAFSSVAPLINTTDTYTYSIYVKITGIDPSTIPDSYYILWLSEVTSTNGSWTTRTNSLSGNWQQISQTVKFKTNVANLSTPYDQSLRFESRNTLPDGAFIYFAAPKLEKGAISTPYSQAPEDVM